MERDDIIILLLAANLIVQAAFVVWLSRRFAAASTASGDRTASRGGAGKDVVIDSCALIDGRIMQIAKAGFLPGTIVIPERVLQELQLLADTADSYKRSRARYGLDTAKALQDALPGRVDIADDGLARNVPVDDAITQLARRRNACLYTTDYNLNKVASLKQVCVLNVNELAGALRPEHLPGETVTVKLVQKGEGRGQGIGYLEEGAMVVVDGGAALLGRTVEVRIDRMLQTEAGRMAFASLKKAAQKKRA
ncbi:TRAM domain-containing protein [Candidatus Saccharibacteria bacterium]|nr:TRAM domain-containing protein [Candidatus Saccharibacteria bacterium]